MKKVIAIVLILLTGCASYTSVLLPQRDVTSLGQYQEIDKVYAGVKFLDRAEVKRYFDADLIEKGIQPIYVTIENNSNKTYSFSKTNVGIPSLDSVEASKKGARNTLARAGAPGVISLFVLWPLAIWAVGDGIASSKANKHLRADYESKEIADGSIRPMQSKHGVLYAPVLKSGEEINITLIEMETKEKIVFRFTKE